jgi:hypothetical protein
MRGKTSHTINILQRFRPFCISSRAPFKRIFGQRTDISMMPAGRPCALPQAPLAIWEHRKVKAMRLPAFCVAFPNAPPPLPHVIHATHCPETAPFANSNASQAPLRSQHHILAAGIHTDARSSRHRAASGQDRRLLWGNSFCIPRQDLRHLPL